MPLVLTNQRTLRDVSKLPFCYLCGEEFGPLDFRNRDHIPPSGLFAKRDRDPPLILATHRRCNQSRSPEDQAIGQLFGVLHGRRVNPKHNKLNVILGRRPDNTQMLAVAEINIREAIRRWIRGFHAALYREYLASDCIFSTCPPLPEGKRVGANFQYVPVPDIVPKFVELLHRNRALANLDQILCRNRRCRYECVWCQADNGQWICIYGLDLYNWKDLGDQNQEPRGCVGGYRRQSGGVPINAATETRLIFDIKIPSPLDPFSH